MVLSWTAGMDLEIINPFMKARQGEWKEEFSSALFCWHSAAFWNIWAELYSSGHTQNRWKVRKGIVMAVVHVISLSNMRKTCAFLWSECVCLVAERSPFTVLSLILPLSHSLNLPFLPWAAVKQVIGINVMFYQLSIMWPYRKMFTALLSTLSPPCVCLCVYVRVCEGMS